MRPAGSLHRHRDHIAHNRRVMRYVVHIAQHELQRMGSRRQLQRHFGLAGAEVQVVVVGRDAEPLVSLAERVRG